MNSRCTGAKGTGRASREVIEHAEDARHIAGKQERDGVFDVGVDAAAVDHRLDNGGEIVVRQDHGGGVLAHLSAGDTHGHADVRLFQGGRVVDAVAGHGDDAAAALPGVDDADFMLRGDTGVDRDAGQLFIQLAVRHSVQLHAVYRQIPVVENAQSAGRWRWRSPCDRR